MQKCVFPFHMCIRKSSELLLKIFAVRSRCLFPTSRHDPVILKRTNFYSWMKCRQALSSSSSSSCEWKVSPVKREPEVKWLLAERWGSRLERLPPSNSSLKWFHLIKSFWIKKVKGKSWTTVVEQTFLKGCLNNMDSRPFLDSRPFIHP